MAKDDFTVGSGVDVKDAAGRARDIEAAILELETLCEAFTAVGMHGSDDGFGVPAWVHVVEAHVLRLRSAYDYRVEVER